MKILLVHNFYGSSAPSGENEVFAAETRMLKARGHVVSQFVRHSDDIRSRGVLGSIQGALSTPWNPWVYSKIRRKLSTFKPDVVHVHNTFPLLSPSVFYAIGGRAARVLTLHNYRLFCAPGIPMRNGQVCTDCLDAKSPWPSIAHACYRNSRLATLPLAASISLHKQLGTWAHQVDQYVALSEFQKNQMCAAGLSSEKIAIKPNFFAGQPAVTAWRDRASRAVYVGRLGDEKGVSELVEAWLAWGPSAPELVIVGDGPLRTSLEEKVAGGKSTNIKFVGQVSADVAQNWIASSKLLVLASRSFEGFPMVLQEAFALGTPVAVSDVGSLPELVGNGRAGAVFRGGDSKNIHEVVSDLWRTQSRLEEMSRSARLEFELKYTEDANYETLMKIYEQAIGGLRRDARRMREFQ